MKVTGGRPTLGATIDYNGNPPQCQLKYYIVLRPGLQIPIQLPAGDWSGLARKLSDQLNGRIDEGSLLGVSAIELAKTVAMIRNPFNLLKPDWKRHASPRGRPPRTAAILQRDEGALKRASNIWLEHRYGWNALWQDIKSVAKTTSKMLADEGPVDDGGGLDAITNKEEFFGIMPQEVYLQGDSPAYWDPTGYYVRNWAKVGAGGAFRARLRSVGKSSAVYRVGCKQVVETAHRWSRSKRLINAYGLDASSIASVLWEIVPFSFVVDWFVDPLGIWRAPSDRQRLHSSDVRGLCSSLKIKADFDLDILLQGNPRSASPNWVGREPVGWTQGYFPGLISCSYRKYSRFTDIPAGGFASIFVEKDLSLIQKTSGIALLAQKFF